MSALGCEMDESCLSPDAMADILAALLCGSRSKMRSAPLDAAAAETTQEGLAQRNACQRQSPLRAGLDPEDLLHRYPPRRHPGFHRVVDQADLCLPQCAAIDKQARIPTIR